MAVPPKKTGKTIKTKKCRENNKEFSLAEKIEFDFHLFKFFEIFYCTCYSGTLHS